MQGRKLYVGGLPYSLSDTQLSDLFAEHGTVDSAKVITDRETGRSRGFGFVEFEDEGNAEAALQALDGKDMGGRALRVNEAQDKERRGGGGRR